MHFLKHFSILVLVVAFKPVSLVGRKTIQTQRGSSQPLY